MPFEKYLGPRGPLHCHNPQSVCRLQTSTRALLSLTLFLDSSSIFTLFRTYARLPSPLSPVLPLTQATLRSAGGAHADAWPAPVSHYEMAVVYWEEAGRENGDRKVLEKCSDELKLVENAEGFDLDARVGLKVTTGRETLRRIKIGH